VAHGKKEQELMQGGQNPKAQPLHAAVAAREPNRPPHLVPLGMFEAEAMWRLEGHP